MDCFDDSDSNFMNINFTTLDNMFRWLVWDARRLIFDNEKSESEQMTVTSKLKLLKRVACKAAEIQLIMKYLEEQIAGFALLKLDKGRHIEQYMFLHDDIDYNAAYRALPKRKRTCAACNDYQRIRKKVPLLHTCNDFLLEHLAKKDENDENVDICDGYNVKLARETKNYDLESHTNAYDFPYNNW